MAEGATVEEVVLPTPEEAQEQATQEPELSEAETKAVAKGWQPEDKYTGDGEWISAEEFNGRAPLYDGLSKQSKRIKSLETVVKTLADQNRKADEIALAKAKAQLKAERVQAHRDEDFDKVVELEDKARELDAKEVDNTDVADADKVAFDEWGVDNKWFGTDEDATLYAKAYGSELAQTDHGLTSAEFYAKVEKKTKAAFPALSGKLPNRGSAPGGQGGANKSATSGKYSQLSAEQKTVCRELVSMGALTQEEYVKQLFDMGELN